MTRLGDRKAGRYVLTPIGRRLLAACLAAADVETDLCPEDEQVHEDEHHLEEEQGAVLSLLVDWVRDAPQTTQDVRAIAGFLGMPLGEVERIVDGLVKGGVIAFVPASS